MSTTRLLLETRVSELRAGDLWLFDGAWVLLTEVTPAAHPDDRVQLLYRQAGETESEFTNPRGNEVAVVKRTPSLPYRRDVLVETLVYHQRTGIKGCHCGWAKPGASHPEHVADVYEEKVQEVRQQGKSLG